MFLGLNFQVENDINEPQCQRQNLHVKATLTICISITCNTFGRRNLHVAQVIKIETQLSSFASLQNDKIKLSYNLVDAFIIRLYFLALVGNHGNVNVDSYWKEDLMFSLKPFKCCCFYNNLELEPS